MKAIKHIQLAFWFSTYCVSVLANSNLASAAQDNSDLEKRIDALIKILGDPEAPGTKLDETRRAIRKLTAIGKPAVPQLILAIIARDNPSSLYSALALDRIGHDAVEQVRIRWQKLDELDKWKLMRFRGQFDYGASLDFALGSLDSKEAHVRREAIVYLGKYVETRARHKLAQMLNVEKPEENRWLIIASLGDIDKNDESVDALTALLAPDNWAAKGVGLMHPLGFAPPWWPDGRPEVVAALCQMDARQAAPKLLQLLQEGGPGKGYAGFDIASVLVKWNYAPCIPELQRILTADKEASSRTIAAKLLFHFKDRAGLPTLIEALESKNVEARRAACHALGEYGDEPEIGAIAKCLADADDEVRLLACRGLERTTGETIHAPGEIVRTLADVPFWKAWFEKNKGRYIKTK